MRRWAKSRLTSASCCASKPRSRNPRPGLVVTEVMPETDRDAAVDAKQLLQWPKRQVDDLDSTHVLDTTFYIMGRK
jgi:hypothetical protein